jgi:hypothetical protein
MVKQVTHHNKIDGQKPQRKHPNPLTPTNPTKVTKTKIHVSNVESTDNFIAVIIVLDLIIGNVLAIRSCRILNS